MRTNIWLFSHSQKILRYLHNRITQFDYNWTNWRFFLFSVLCVDITWLSWNFSGSQSFMVRDDRNTMDLFFQISNLRGVVPWKEEPYHRWLRCPCYLQCSRFKHSFSKFSSYKYWDQNSKSIKFQSLKIAKNLNFRYF